MNYNKINPEWIEFIFEKNTYYYNIKNNKKYIHKPNVLYMPEKNSNWIIFKDSKTNKFYYYNISLKVKTWFPYFLTPSFSSINNFTFEHFYKDIYDYTLYISNGKSYNKNKITNKIFDRISNENTLIIAASICGKVGLIKHISESWNNQNPFNPLHIIWKNMSSYKIFNDMNNIDLAITSEPLIESKNNKIENLEHLFLNQFEIVIPPNDIYNIKKLNSTEPIEIIYHIMVEVFSLDLNDNKYFKIYIINSKYSTIYIKENFLFFSAINKIINEGLNNINFNKKFESYYNLANLNYDQKMDTIYNAWMNHVYDFEHESMDSILNKIKYETLYNNCYHINDRYIIYKNNMENNMITNTSDVNLLDPLQNYSQIWSPIGILKENTTQYLFYQWLLKNKSSLLNRWFPSDEIGTKMKKNKYFSLFYSDSKYNFNQVETNYKKLMEDFIEFKALYGSFSKFL